MKSTAARLLHWRSRVNREGVYLSQENTIQYTRGLKDAVDY
jgi:hypothetical protein